MKVNCALVASLLIGVCDLLTGVRAYSDYNAELDARDNIDYLSTRDFAYDYQDLDAREPVAIEIPFHPSIRDFLEEAALMYRRAPQAGGGKKPEPKPAPPQAEKIASISFETQPSLNPKKALIVNAVDVYKGDTGSTIKKSIRKRVSEIGPNYYPPLPDQIELRVGKKMVDAVVLGDDVLFNLSKDIKFWVTEPNWKPEPLPTSPKPDVKQIPGTVKFVIVPAVSPRGDIADVVDVDFGSTGGTIKASIRYWLKARKRLELRQKITLKVGEERGGKEKAKVLKDKDLVETAVLHLDGPFMFWVDE
ncbi:hypothetical protein D9611_015028 [Ephemerocybe angulata]|uniref:Uncharacterized protein n=1 Tax=Ephemerocybe angulata TaxID=980116 RepID=A0A8H5CAJ3_9AGAR|nr:hypothetical protein D9611_015028 [Tulosesus angulatus]